MLPRITTRLHMKGVMHALQKFVLHTSCHVFAAWRFQLISRHDARAGYLRLVSASQVASDSDLRSLLTTMQSEITRLKALLDVKPAASPAKASVEPEEGEPQGEKDEEGEEDGEECDEGNEEEGEEDEEEGVSDHETPPPKGAKPAQTSVAKAKNPKGPNSSSHRAEWMKFTRRMDSQGSEFPEMTKMWNGTKEETWLL